MRSGGIDSLDAMVHPGKSKRDLMWEHKRKAFLAKKQQESGGGVPFNSPAADQYRSAAPPMAHQGVPPLAGLSQQPPPPAYSAYPQADSLDRELGTGSERSRQSQAPSWSHASSVTSHAPSHAPSAQGPPRGRELQTPYGEMQQPYEKSGGGMHGLARRGAGAAAPQQSYCSSDDYQGCHAPYRSQTPPQQAQAPRGAPYAPYGDHAPEESNRGGRARCPVPQPQSYAADLQQQMRDNEARRARPAPEPASARPPQAPSVGGAKEEYREALRRQMQEKEERDGRGRHGSRGGTPQQRQPSPCRPSPYAYDQPQSYDQAPAHPPSSHSRQPESKESYAAALRAQMQEKENRGSYRRDHSARGSARDGASHYGDNSYGAQGAPYGQPDNRRTQQQDYARDLQQQMQEKRSRGGASQPPTGRAAYEAPQPEVVRRPPGGYSQGLW